MCREKNQSSILIRGRENRVSIFLHFYLTDYRTDICKYRVASLLKKAKADPAFYEKSYTNY